MNFTGTSSCTTPPPQQPAKQRRSDKSVRRQEFPELLHGTLVSNDDDDDDDDVSFGSKSRVGLTTTPNARTRWEREEKLYTASKCIPGLRASPVSI